MTIRFNSELLFQDVDTLRKRKRISLQRASLRMGLHDSTLYNLKSGKIKDITVTTLARIMYFLNVTDISKYIYDDGE